MLAELEQQQMDTLSDMVMDTQESNSKIQKNTEVQHDVDESDSSSSGSGTTLNTENILKARDQSSKNTKFLMYVILVCHVMLTLF